MSRLRDNYIECIDSTRIYFADRNPNVYKNKIILLYGSTGSGKSTLLKDILYILRKEMSLAIVFCPTNFVNNDYENLIPDELIYKEVDPSVVETIFQTQEYRTKLHTIANNPNMLRCLFDKIASPQDKMMTRMFFDKARSLIHDIENSNKLDPGQKKNEENAIEKERDKKLINVFKNCIRKSRNKFRDMKLNKNEEIAVKYLDMNPNMVLIFDDCLSSAQKWKNTEIFKALFMQGRQYNITQIYTLQDGVGIPPGLRHQAQISIFTTPQSAISHFQSKNNAYSTKEKRDAEKVAQRIFDQKKGLAKNHQKLVYDKFSNEYRVMIAELHDSDFRMGSTYVWKYSEKLPRKDKEKMELKTNKDYLKDL